MGEPFPSVDDTGGKKDCQASGEKELITKIPPIILHEGVRHWVVLTPIEEQRADQVGGVNNSCDFSFITDTSYF